MVRRSAVVIAAAVAVALGLSATVQAQLDRDPRAARPTPPNTLDTLVERFLSAYSPHGVDGTVSLVIGQEHTFTQSVEAGVCYAVAAVGDVAVDVDIRVRRSGEIIAQDVSLDSYPIVEWCAETTGTDTVSVTAFDGDTSVEYALFIDRNSRRMAAGPLDELSNRLAAHVGSAAPRWRWVGTQWRTEFEREGVHEMFTEVPDDGCVAVAAVGQVQVQDIDIVLEDASGRELARDFDMDALPLVVHCGAAGTKVTARIAVRRGRGVVAAQVLAASPAQGRATGR